MSGSVDPRVLQAFGAAAFGMQANEYAMAIAVKENLIELKKVDAAAIKRIQRATFGGLLREIGEQVRPKFEIERGELERYVSNRNYVAHRFFVDFVRVLEASQDQERVINDACRFLTACARDAILAAHRIAEIVAGLDLPLHREHGKRMDLEFMTRFGILPTEGIALRTFGNA